MKFRLFLFALVFLAFNFAAPVPLSGEPAAHIEVDAGQVLAQVNPMLFGQNLGIGANATPQYIRYYQDAGVTLLRFPGGNYGDENDLYHNNLDDLAALAKQLNAQVSVQVRSWRLGTPEKAAEYVRYCNIEKKYAFVYWEVGNEPNLYNNRLNQPGDPLFDVNWYNAQYRQYVTAMKAVDPTIKIFGPVVDQNGTLWLPDFIRANGDIIDGLSWHYYGHGNQLDDAQALQTQAYITTQVRAIRNRWKDPQVNPLGYKRPVPPLFLSEYNVSWASSVSRHLGGPVAALWNAELLGRLANEGVEMGAHFALQGTSWQGMVGRLNDPRPAYGTYELFSHWGVQEVAAVSSDEKILPAFASLRKDGSLVLLVINKDALQSLTADLLLNSFNPAGTAQVWAVEQSQPVAVQKPALTTLSPFTYTFPPYSVTLFILPPARFSWLWFALGMVCALLLGLAVLRWQRMRQA